MSKFEIPLQVTESIIRLGQHIRVARIRRGWSVADLAGKAGINRNTLTALEQLTVIITAIKFSKIKIADRTFLSKKGV